MASDVEVLRKLLEAFATGYFSGNAWVVEAPIREGAYPASDPARDTKAALSSAISALEAREAQPKVEGRMDDETARLHVHSTCSALTCVHAEMTRARASEAALSERVATLEKVLGECGVCKGLISPPSKPETHQERVHDPARHAWVKPFSDGSDLCYQCRRPKSEHREAP